MVGSKARGRCSFAAGGAAGRGSRVRRGGAHGLAVRGEELVAAGVSAHLAEPGDAATLRGRKRRPKTDRADARHRRMLLAQGRLPESRIPPAHNLRELAQLRKTLGVQRVQWQQRIHAVLFHRGVPAPSRR